MRFPVLCKKVALCTFLVVLLPLLVCGQEDLDVLRGMANEQNASDMIVQDERRLFNLWNILFMLSPDGCPPIGKPHHDCIKKKHGGGGGGGGSSSGSGGGGGSYSGSGSYHGSSSYNSASSGDDSIGKSGLSAALSNNFTLVMLIAAAAAVILATAAIMMGTRKRPKESHALAGSVARRMGLFSNFAHSSLANNTNRPQRVVEMTIPENEDYKGMV